MMFVRCFLILRGDLILILINFVGEFDCMFVVVFTLLTFLGGGIHHLVVLVMMRSVMFIHMHSMISFSLLLLTRVLVGRMELIW